MKNEFNKCDSLKNIIILVASILVTMYITYFIISDKLTHNSSVFRTVGALNNLDDINKKNIGEIQFRESILIYSVILNIDIESLEDYQVMCSSLTENIHHDIIATIESKTELPVDQKIKFKKKYEILNKFCNKSKSS